MFDDTRTLFRDHGGLMAASFVLILFSVFGQSVFFGAYLPVLREDLGLSKTGIGSLYAIATIASSIVIIFTGKGLDRFPLRHYMVFVFAGLAAGCFLMAGAQNIVMLLGAFFLLRQFGQGLMVLSSHTAINRYLTENRGKAVAITNMGGAAQLVIFPLMALSLAEYISWREAWVYYGIFVLAVLLPGFWFYLKSHQRTTHARWLAQLEAEKEKAAEQADLQWSLNHVLKDWRFYGLVSIAIIPAFVGTAIFFYQHEIAASLDMTPIAFAASFPFWTAAMVTFSIIAGYLIDKFGEKPVLVAFPLLFTLGLALLTHSSHFLLAFTGMVIIGGANGMMNTIGGPLLAYLYGTQHLGSIKSMLFSANILASALSPFTFGLFMDLGYDVTTQLSWIIYYSAGIWLIAFPLCSKPKRLKTE